MSGCHQAKRNWILNPVSILSMALLSTTGTVARVVTPAKPKDKPYRDMDSLGVPDRNLFEVLDINASTNSWWLP